MAAVGSDVPEVASQPTVEPRFVPIPDVQQDDEQIGEAIAAAPAVAPVKVRKTRVAKPKTAVIPVAPTELPSAPAIAPWFFRRTNINGRSRVYVNDATEETDVLSLAIHSGIATDEALTIFMQRPEILTSLATATTAVLAHTAKIVGNPDGIIVRRYYTTADGAVEPISVDPRIGYQPAPDDRPARWAVRGFLVGHLCTLLDENQRTQILVDVGPRVSASASADSDRPATSAGVISASGASMTTFRGQRRNLLDIPISEIEAAERDIQTTSSMTLARELIYIRRALHTNCEKAVVLMCGRVRDAEGVARAESILRIKDVSAVTSSRDQEIASLVSSRAMDIAAITVSRDHGIESIRTRSILRADEEASRLNLVTEYLEGMIRMTWRLALFGIKQRVVQVAAADTAAVELVAATGSSEETISRLKEELEDANLEIARLKDDSRGKLVPRPKVHHKPKNPDLRLATDAEIARGVKNFLATSQCGKMGTPTSSVGGAMVRARRRGNLPSFEASSSPMPGMTKSTSELGIVEEREIDAARLLRSLSRLREKDLCDAEATSEQLSDVIEALSTILTRVSLTVDEVASRRSSILNHMRSLAMHSRGITSIIRERPYLLSLARRMNHERKPVVKLAPLRALINVAAANLKALKDVESITLESVGGAFTVMSLEEAVSSSRVAMLEEEAWCEASGADAVIAVPDGDAVSASRRSTPKIVNTGNIVVEKSAPRPLTRTTLRRHTAVMASSARQGDGNVSGDDSSVSPQSVDE